MVNNKFNIGKQVSTQFPDLEACTGTIIERPVFKNGKAIFKVSHDDWENWHLVEHLTAYPFLVKHG
ncbi:MAG: hypothetical protein ACI92Z_003643 [Paracoccaceae bacterium]|jgi:hypothetical protein